MDKKEFRYIIEDEINKKYLEDNKYKYCLIYYLDSLIFGDLADIDELEKDILVEGFFFDEEKELHVFRDENDELKAVLTKHDEVAEEDKVLEVFALKAKVGNMQKKKYTELEVVNCLAYEEDGQAYIKYTALKGVR